MAITEGSAGLLPKSADTLPLTAPAFHGLAADATTNPAMWAQRSMAAGDGLNYRYVVASGLYLKNGATADAGVNAAGIASGKGIAATLFGATGTTPLLPNAAVLADGATVPTTTTVGAALLGYNGTTEDQVRTAPAAGGALGTAGALAAASVLYDPGGATYRPARSANGTGDGVAGASTLTVADYAFDESAWNRKRGNTSVVLLASAARTASTVTAAQVNYNGRGIHLDLAVSAKAGTTTLTVQLINAGNAVIATSAALAAAAGQTYSVQFYPGVLAADFSTNGSGKSVALPRAYAIQVLHSDASSVTYSLTGQTLV